MEETLKELRKKIAHDVSKIHKVDGLVRTSKKKKILKNFLSMLKQV